MGLLLILFHGAIFILSGISLFFIYRTKSELFFQPKLYLYGLGASLLLWGIFIAYIKIKGEAYAFSPYFEIHGIHVLAMTGVLGSQFGSRTFSPSMQFYITISGLVTLGIMWIFWLSKADLHKLLQIRTFY